MSTLADKIIRAIELIIIEEGQHDPKFKLGETIKYSPAEITKILQEHKNEIIDVLDTFGR